jgi:hypothetical protein
VAAVLFGMVQVDTKTFMKVQTLETIFVFICICLDALGDQGS